LSKEREGGLPSHPPERSREEGQHEVRKKVFASHEGGELEKSKEKRPCSLAEKKEKRPTPPSQGVREKKTISRRPLPPGQEKRIPAPLLLEKSKY